MPWLYWMVLISFPLLLAHQLNLEHHCIPSLLKIDYDNETNGKWEFSLPKGRRHPWPQFPNIEVCQVISGVDGVSGGWHAMCMSLVNKRALLLTHSLSGGLSAPLVCTSNLHLWSALVCLWWQIWWMFSAMALYLACAQHDSCYESKYMSLRVMKYGHFC